MRFSVSKMLALAALLAPLGAQAQEAAAAPLNPAPYLLFGALAILLFANILMANVLRQLTETLRDKNRKDRLAAAASKTAALLLLLLLPASGLWAQDAAAGEAAAPVYTLWNNPAPLAGMPRLQFLFLIGMAALLLVVLIVQASMVYSLVRVLRGIPEKAPAAEAIVKRSFLDVFNKSVAVEKEADILLDHDYDGIRELDNDLPPWWKWGFVATIISSVLYLGYYHAWGGPSQADEYHMAMKAAEEEKLLYLAKSGEKIDENNVTKVLDPGQLADAKALYTNTCAACHGADGGGGVGPNLTDDYWLHGGGLKEVFKSIKYGYADKGMPPWNGNLSARQIAGLTSFVKDLKGTNPPGAKAPQGELFVEGGDASVDSVSNQTDISLTPTGTTENKDNPIGPYKNKADGKGEGTPPGNLKK